MLGFGVYEISGQLEIVDELSVVGTQPFTDVLG